MSAKEKIFVFGASGHAKVVIDIIERQGLYEIVFMVDDNPALKGQGFFGYPVLGGKADLLSLSNRPRQVIVAIGNNRVRAMVAGWLADNGFNLVSAVHPSAQVARGSTIGVGTVLMAGVVVNTDARIGDNVIVNTRAGIDHDCIIGNNVHIAPGSTLCGTVTIGDGTFVCSGTTIIPNLIIGKHVTIGAGSTVIRNVPDGVTVVGSPAQQRS